MAQSSLSTCKPYTHCTPLSLVAAIGDGQQQGPAREMIAVWGTVPNRRGRLPLSRGRATARGPETSDPSSRAGEP